MAVFSGNIFGSSGGGGGTANYNDLNNKPEVNNVVLQGQKTLRELSIYSIGEVDNMLASMRSVKVVDTKPTNPVANTMYYVGTESPYHIYLYDSDIQEIDLGLSELDFSEYLKKTELDNITLLYNGTTHKASCKAIIEVETLPTEDILTTILYKDNADGGKIKYYSGTEWKVVGEGGKVAIDDVELTQTTTRSDLKLVGNDDIIKDSEFVEPKANGIDIVLDTGTTYNPDIINDDPAYQYANNKTSSNNYINTRLETIERKADSKTVTKFVDERPSNPEINTEYYVTVGTDLYNRYFVDSLGVIRSLGTTQMDISTLASKQELNLKEDLSNKTTTLDDSSTDTQYPSAKAVVDLVKNSGDGSQIVETILWQSPNGIAGTSFYSGTADITLTDTIKDYHLFKFTVNRDDNKFCSFYLTSKDIQLFSGSSYRFITSVSFDAETSYLLVNIPTTTETNILSINSSNKCNLVNITGYKSIPVLNTYSREIRELIMDTPTGSASQTSGNITLTKGMSNYDYLDIYYQCAEFSNTINSNKRIRVSDLIEYYNSSNLQLRLEVSDLSNSRKYISIYRSSDTVIHYDSYNLKMMKIYGVKAEPVVYDTFLPAKLYKHNIQWGNGSNNYCYFSFTSTRSTPYTDKVEMANDMISAGISATSPVNCYNSYNQQGLLYVAYYTENGTMYYKISYEASSYGASSWTYLMGDTVTPLYSVATAGSPICIDASSDVGITLSWGSSIMQASKEYYKVRFDNKTRHTFNLNILLCGNNYSAGSQYALTSAAITGLDLPPATDYQSSLVCATAIKHQTATSGSTFSYVMCSLSLIDKKIYFYFGTAVSFSQNNKYCMPIHFEWWK